MERQMCTVLRYGSTECAPLLLPLNMDLKKIDFWPPLLSFFITIRMHCHHLTPSEI